MITLSVVAPRNRIRKQEASLKYEKKLIEDLVKQRLFSRAGEITDALINRALEGDVVAIKESYDRMFGKAKQTIDVETDGAPIVFMPAVLVNKFRLNASSEALPEAISSPLQASQETPIIHEHEGSI